MAADTDERVALVRSAILAAIVKEASITSFYGPFSLDDELGQFLDTRCHRSRVAVQRRSRGERGGQCLGVHLGDALGVERLAESSLELQGACERPLQGDLLVENHPDEQSERTLREQRVGLGFLAEMKFHESRA